MGGMALVLVGALGIKTIETVGEVGRGQPKKAEYDTVLAAGEDQVAGKGVAGSAAGSNQLTN